MKLFLSLVFFLVIFSSTAQEPVYALKNDKVYLVHVVEGGQTLYSLMKTYEVDEEELKKINPELSEGLKIGQRILIPTNLSPDKVTLNKDTTKLKLCDHLVKRKETLYGISRQYKQSVTELLELNPEVKEGLKVGQVIKVRCKEQEVAKANDEDFKSVSLVEDEEVVDSLDTSQLIVKKDFSEQIYNDSTITYVVKPGETLYSLSKRFMVHVDTLSSVNNIKGYRISEGDNLIIPLKKEKIEPIGFKEIKFNQNWLDSLNVKSVPIQSKDGYSISVLVPFKIDENIQILEKLDDQNTRLNRVTDIALDFYLGVKYALDSLEKIGLNAQVNFYDTQGDTSILSNILNKNAVLNSDIVIGPFFPKTIEKTAKWALENQKRVYIPVSLNTKVLKENPYLYSSVPSELTLFSGMASYIVEHYPTSNIVIADGNNIIERDRIDFFKSQLAYYSTQTGKTINFSIAALGSGTGRDLARKFDLDSMNIFISLSKDPQFVMRFINTLNAAKNQTPQHSDAPLIVVGSKEWLDISALTSYYKNRFSLHVPQSSFLNYKDEELNIFVEKIQSEEQIDPSRFFFQGFDLMFHIGNQILLNYPTARGYMNDFSFNSLGSISGVENQTAFITVQSNFELKVVKIVKNKVVLDGMNPIKELNPKNVQKGNEGDN